MGDFNIDLLQYDSNPKTNIFLDNIFAVGFVPVIFKPTRITDSTATLLDHRYTNNIKELKQSAIIITDVADHLGTAVFFNKTIKCQERQTVKMSRDLGEKNIHNFKNYLLHYDFSPVLRSQCPNESYSIFLNIYQTGYDQFFPLHKINSNNKRKKNPWYTKELKLA